MKQYYIKKLKNNEKTEPMIFSLPFNYGKTSFGANVSFDELKQAGFVKYVKANLSVPALKVLDYVEYIDLNENEGTFKAVFRDMNTNEEINYFGTELDLDGWKSAYIKSFNLYANKAYKKYLEQYPDLEQSSFTQKAQEAFKVIENENIELSETPYLSNLVNKNKSARNELAKAVNQKVVYITSFEQFCVAKRDSIKACKTIEEVKSIVIDLSDMSI